MLAAYETLFDHNITYLVVKVCILSTDIARDVPYIEIDGTLNCTVTHNLRTTEFLQSKNQKHFFQSEFEK